MGFGFPKAERDGLIASDPETFFLPPTSRPALPVGVRPPARLDDDEMRELVIDAWRMCTPKMLHELPEQPAAGGRGLGGDGRSRSGASCGRCCIPYLHLTDGDVGAPRPEQGARPPARRTRRRGRRAEVEVRDGQVYRWRGLGARDWQR